MDPAVLAVFVAVYAGMVLGEIPGLALDRTGVALLGAIALLALGKLDLGSAWGAVDVPTLALLFALMIVSAQFRLGGFYARLTRTIASADAGPRTLLALVIAAAGGLSALLANDIVCLAMTPVLVEGCARRGLNPRPFLIALACASNVGSAATLIGNPQNMLVGEKLDVSFAGYLQDAALPAVLGLGAVWWLVATLSRKDWHASCPVPEIDVPAYDAWQSGKGLVVLGALVLGFLATPWPREILALGAAGVLLSSRRMASRDILGLVDWHLLVLFMGLFVVNHAAAASGTLAVLVAAVQGAGVDPTSPSWLFALSVVLSNLVSNVPAVMLLLPQAVHPASASVLALGSTLAGNLFVVGSIANIIVIEQAALLGVRIGWREHARFGIPITLVTLAVAAAWLVFRYAGAAGH
jgi:Na+/H+ antiporter NhaD/arsenite permease-like protein